MLAFRFVKFQFNRDSKRALMNLSGLLELHTDADAPVCNQFDIYQPPGCDMDNVHNLVLVSCFPSSWLT